MLLSAFPHCGSVATEAPCANQGPEMGNCLAVRIPKAVSAEAGFEKDREVEVFVEARRLIATSYGCPSAPPARSESSSKASGHLALHREVDWGPPVGKETC